MNADTNKPAPIAEPASEPTPLHHIINMRWAYEQACDLADWANANGTTLGNEEKLYQAAIKLRDTLGKATHAVLPVPAPAVDERTPDSGHLAAASNGSPGGESRLHRKLEKRDQRIAGMKRRIEALEHALATRTMDLGSLSGNVERAVTHALCNVRMIPVHGFGRDPKIVEVKLTDAPRRSAATSPEADGQMKKD